MQLNDPFCQRKTQPVPLGGTGGVALVEFFEYPPFHLIIHTDPVVRDTYDQK